MYTQNKKEVRSNHQAERLKSHYANSYEEEIIRSFGFFHPVWKKTVYPEIRNNNFRFFSTTQERSFYLMHSIEYKIEYGLKLRQKRSSRNLPDSYDDFHSDVYGAKSWKDRAKRKRQYYR